MLLSLLLYKNVWSYQAYRFLNNAFFNIYSSRYIYNMIRDSNRQGGIGVLADFMQKNKKNSLFLGIPIVKLKEEKKYEEIYEP